jgi:5-methylcytosine-specific restriction endonuclease McrA
LSGPRVPDAPGRYIPLATRSRVVMESGGVCFYCGNLLSTLTVDHVIPWSQGGSHHPLNLVAACGVCNSIAGERLFRDITDKIVFIGERRVLLGLVA